MEVCRPSIASSDSAELTELRAHLAECEACRARFEAQQRQDAAIGRAVRDIPIPPGLKAAILSRLAPPAPATIPVRRRRWIPIALAGAAAAVLLAVGLMVLTARRGPAVVEIRNRAVLQWAEGGLADGLGQVLPADYRPDQIESWCWTELHVHATVPPSVALPGGWAIAVFRTDLRNHPVAGFQYRDRTQTPKVVIYALPMEMFRPPKRTREHFEDRFYSDGQPTHYSVAHWHYDSDQMSYLAVSRFSPEGLDRFLNPPGSNSLAWYSEADGRGHPRARGQATAARGWSVGRMIELVGFHKK